MNVLFHYYAIRWLCGEAGISEVDSEIIARSSQFVDEATRPLLIETGGTAYETIVTQDYVFWDETILWNVYLPFHFVPGSGQEAARQRLDGKQNAWAVTANGAVVKELLIEALKTRDPYRIGIALHPFADSWAHQNFSARREDFNALEGAEALPPVGHLQALTLPDDPSRAWTDSRLLPELSRIDNMERFLGAARKIFRYLRTYLRRPFKEEELLLSKLKAMMEAPGGREGAIAAFMVDGNTPRYDKSEWLRAAGILGETERNEPFPGYDKVLWFKSQAERRLGSGERRLYDGKGFFDSDLYRWNEAALTHRKVARAALANL